MGLDADNFVSKLGSCLQWVAVMGRLATADWSVTAESGLTCYLWGIRRFPMMEPHEEYVLAKRWREHGDQRGGAQARQQSFTPRREDRQGLSRLRPADL